MSLNTKQFIIGFLGLLFLVSLVFVQYMEIERRKEETGQTRHISIPDSSSRSSRTSIRRPSH